jgi:hypothetical protein
MKRTAFAAALVVGLMALVLTPWAISQRPFSAAYDNTKQVKLSGAVVKIDWGNPQAFIYIDVRNAGASTMWAIEIGNPLELEKNGWPRTALKIGDIVAIEGFPARDDKREAFANTVTLTSSGKRLFTAPASTAAASTAAATPRWPDGQPRLGPAPGKKGYWTSAKTVTLRDNSIANIQVRDDGLLANSGDVDRVAPFEPWARAVYERRQRTRLIDDPLTRCMPPGGPRQFQTPNGFQFIEQRELGRILILFGGGNRNWRIIYTDGRAQSVPAELVLSYYGNSVGRWDKDTLTVDAIGFNEKFWMTKGGLPHTEALHLTERFTRTDLNSLKYEVTVDDPRAYTKPWTGGWTMQWTPDKEIEEYFCEDNAGPALSR